MDIRKAQLSFFHLFMIVKQDIADVVDTLSKHDQLPQILYYHICKYTIIRTCAFYEELEKFTMKVLQVMRIDTLF